MSEKPNVFFTIDEVNALVPRLEEHFEKFWSFRQSAHVILQELRAHYKDPNALSVKQAVAQQIRQSQAYFMLSQAQDEIDQITDLGCEVKDFEMGLVDFSHLLETGEPVHLCWKFGEKRVRFWHGLSEGFANRKPLSRKVSSF